MARERDAFLRDEQPGRDDHDVLRPYRPEPEPETLDQLNRALQDREFAEEPDRLRLDQPDLYKQELHVMVLGGYPRNLNEMERGRG